MQSSAPSFQIERADHRTMHPLMALIEQYHAFDRIPFHRVRMERGLLHLFSNPHLGGAWGPRDGKSTFAKPLMAA